MVVLKPLDIALIVFGSAAIGLMFGLIFSPKLERESVIAELRTDFEELFKK